MNGVLWVEASGRERVEKWSVKNVSGRGLVIRTREAGHRRGLVLTRFSPSAVLLCDKDELVAILPNLLMSTEDEISLAALTNSERKGGST